MLPTAILALAAALLPGSLCQAESWNYNQQGGDWGELCRSGRLQSPVNIETDRVAEVNQGRSLYFINYHRLTPVRVEVDLAHYTVKVTPISNYNLYISGGGLPGKYVLDSLHFHWPSEHTINGQRGLMEGHFVHRKDIYNSTAEAAKDPEGLAVLGIIYTESKDNLELFKIEASARDGQTTYINFDHMLPYDKSEFYRYKGSLTTPTCAESVIWTIFKNYVPASPLQVAAFRGLLPEKDQTLDTYRTAQPLNGRVVELWSTANHQGLNRVHHFHASPHILFAMLPGLSNSIHFPYFLKKYV